MDSNYETITTSCQQGFGEISEVCRHFQRENRKSFHEAAILPKTKQEEL